MGPLVTLPSYMLASVERILADPCHTDYFNLTPRIYYTHQIAHEGRYPYPLV